MVGRVTDNKLIVQGADTAAEFKAWVETANEAAEFNARSDPLDPLAPGAPDGDGDNDGLDEVGVARKAGVHARYWILDDYPRGFRTIYGGGERWGSETHATSIAFGNVGEDRLEEIGFIVTLDTLEDG